MAGHQLLNSFVLLLKLTSLALNQDEAVASLVDETPPVLVTSSWMTAIKLLDNLTHPLNYDKRMRPANASQVDSPLSVNVSIYVVALGSLDSSSSELAIQTDLVFQWIDPRLRFVDSRVTLIQGEDWARDKIWIPMFTVGNEKNSNRILIPKENVQVSFTPAGLVSYRNRLMFRVYCSVDVRKFPFDQQNCRFYLDSWSLRDTELVFVWSQHNGGVEVNPEFSPMDFTLATVATSPSPLSRPSFSGNVSRLFVTFTLERNWGHYVIDFFVPAALLVGLSWMSFWFDPTQVAGRISLGSGALLSFLTLSRTISSMFPKVAYVTAMDTYALLCLGFIIASLVEFAFVNRLWRRQERVVSIGSIGSATLMTGVTGCLRRQPRRMNNRHLAAHKLDSLSITTSDSSSLKQTNQLTVTSLMSMSSNVEPTADLSTHPPLDAATATISKSTIAAAKSVSTHQVLGKLLDRKSRAFFPILFLIANVLYWFIVWM